MELQITRWDRDHSPKQDELVDNMKAEGLVPYVEDDEPGHEYEPHIHPNDEVLVVVSGELTLGVGDDSWVLRAGDRIDLPADTSHWAETGGTETIRILTASIGDKHDPLRASHTEENLA